MTSDRGSDGGSQIQVTRGSDEVLVGPSTRV